MAQVLTHAPNELVANMICERLTEAGIKNASAGTSRGQVFTGSTAIYVKDEDVERAREVLREARAITDEELAAASDAATRQSRAQATDPEPGEP